MARNSQTDRRRRTFQFRRVLAATAAAAAAVAWSGGAAAAAGPAATTDSSQLPQGDEPVNLDPANFTVDIDNPYWPMKPGTRWTYRGTEGNRPIEEVVVATTKTKKIANGVTARVVRDTAYRGGELIEDTFDWYAQDKDGNVWYLGEDTAEFKDGKVSNTGGSFEAGVDGALPGIIMPGNPQPGMKYRQEYYKGEAEDNGEVLSTTERARLPAGHFDHMVLTKDTITHDANALEYKLYAPGVGLVLSLGVTGGGRQPLVKVDQAPPNAGTGPRGKPNP